MHRRRVAGLKAVADILEASDRHLGAQILENLAAYDRELAGKLGPPEIDFEDFVRLDSRSLSAILEAAEPDLVMLALVGASPELCARILDLLPDTEAQALRHHLEHPGPTRLSDVEEARRRLSETARRLAIQARVKLPSRFPRRSS
jgi:flagellar motor switch protein FliG